MRATPFSTQLVRRIGVSACELKPRATTSSMGGKIPTGFRLASILRQAERSAAERGAGRGRGPSCGSCLFWSRGAGDPPRHERALDGFDREDRHEQRSVTPFLAGMGTLPGPELMSELQGWVFHIARMGEKHGPLLQENHISLCSVAL